MSLTEIEKGRFFKDGYIVVENLITEDELVSLRQYYEDIVLNRASEFPKDNIILRPINGKEEIPVEAATSHGPNHNRRGTQIFPKGEDAYDTKRSIRVSDPLDAIQSIKAPSRNHPGFDTFVHHPRIVNIIADLMGPDIVLYYDQFFAKPPYARANRYHQDSVFWAFFASNFQITCQLMLDDSTVENGCVRFIPGIDFGLVNWDHLPTLLTPDLLSREVSVPIRAGDATFHHSLALHCSGPNTTAQRRRGWSIHYASATTRYIGTPDESERLKNLGCLAGPEPTNGFPLISGRRYPDCL